MFWLFDPLRHAHLDMTVYRSPAIAIAMTAFHFLPTRGTMSIQFPNPSRSYDASRHGVSFWGYDESREVAFVVGDALLANLNPGMGEDEAAALSAFDQHRARILTLAKSAYSGAPKRLYVIG